jgi:hypothetical protein
MPHLRRQQGQASVFVLALLGVVLVCAVFLYTSGRVTSEKMQLQNAADAAAFGAATLEARSLNFAAYTNRAMVANEVAVGQLIGLLSWTDQLTQSEEYGDVYTAAIEVAGQALSAILIETVGGAAVVEAATDIITATIDTIDGVLTAVGEAMETFLDAFIAPTIGGLSLINEMYSNSQKIYHGATYALVVKNVYQSLEDNIVGVKFNRNDLFKKDLDGAQLSDLGIIALVGHVPSFWSGYTRIYTSPALQKPKKKKKKDDQKKENEKLAEVKKQPDKKPKPDKKQKKKDPKKKPKKPRKKKESKRAKNNRMGMGRFAATVREARDPFSSGGAPEGKNRDWKLELDLRLYKRVFGIKVGTEVAFGAESLGASELRQKGNSFVWSAADSNVAGLKFRVFGHWYPIPPPGEAPFNAGGFQAPGNLSSPLLPDDILPSSPAALTYGNRKLAAYGGAGSTTHLLAWPGVMKDMEEDAVESYKGLQPYRDMTQLDEKRSGDPAIPFQAPFFLIGVTRTLHDFIAKGPQFTGRLNITGLKHRGDIDRLGAIARSELYFSRPTDLSYFARLDKMQEKPNVFSPFWQARLVDTTDRDRFLALAMQQKVLWLTEKEKKLLGGSVLDDVTHAVDDVLDTAGGIIDRILRLFL